MVKGCWVETKDLIWEMKYNLSDPVSCVSGDDDKPCSELYVM